MADQSGGRGPMRPVRVRIRGPSSGQEQQPGRRGRPPWRAPVQGLAVQGRWGTPGAAHPATRLEPWPLAAAAARAPPGFIPRILGRRGSGSGTGGGGGRPAGGSHRSQTSQLS